MSHRIIACDIESVDLSAWHDPNTTVHFVAFHDEEGGFILDIDDAVSYINESPDDELFLFHHAPFDVPALRIRGASLDRGKYIDSLPLSHVYNPAREQHGLESWGEELGLEKLEFNDFSKRTPQMERYGLRDVELTYTLWHHLVSMLSDEEMEYYWTQALPYTELIIEMQSTGMFIDNEKLLPLREQLQSEMSEHLATIHSIAPYAPGKCREYGSGVYKTSFPGKLEDALALASTGYRASWVPQSKRVQVQYYSRCELDTFNPNSATHIVYALQTLYGWEPTEFTETGKPKTGKEVLENTGYPIVVALLNYLQLAKLDNTFLNALDTKQDSNGFIHPTFKQTGTVTGRLSSENPNAQNIPTRSKTGELIRELISVPHEGIRIVGGDLSNIEGRMLAYYMYELLGDRKLLDIFAADQDFHAMNATNWGFIELVKSLIPGVSDEDAFKYARNIAKTALYAVLYGAGAGKIAVGASRGMPISLTKEHGQLVMDTMDRNMPAIMQLKETVWETARDNGGMLYSLNGRRLVYPDLLSRDRSKRARAERQVFNAVLQGGAADVVQTLQLSSTPIVHNYGGLWFGQIHDEALSYVQTKYASQMAEELTAHWSASKLIHPVPITAQFKVGKTWRDVH